MEIKVKILENEYWWGGSSATGDRLPLSADSQYSASRTFTSNQTMPFWVSTAGRYVYGHKAMDIKVEKGEMTFTSDGEIELFDAADDLRGAYLAGMKKHFPFSGKPVNKDFFRYTQFNTWIEFMTDQTQEGVLKYAHEIVDQGLAPGVLMIDGGWQVDYGQHRFRPEAFPDPKAMVDELHSLGFKLLLWVSPMVTPVGQGFIHNYWGNPDLFMRRKGDRKVLLTEWWEGFSAILDLSKDADKQYLGDQLKELMDKYGVDGFKFDGGNAYMYDPGHTVNGEPDSDLDMYELNQAYNKFLLDYEYHEIKDSYGCGGMPIIQRLRDKHPRYEDEGILSLIPDGAIAGLTGHPFICPDMVGGGDYINFMPGNEFDHELFVRWAQCSALFPMMQYSKKPWTCLTKEENDAVIAAGKLHEQLGDYIVKEVEKSEVTGEPILRLLEYSYPHMGFESCKDEFMLGDDILVAPVLEAGARKREVKFPSGRWKDQNGKVYDGNTTCTVDAPLDFLPWFTRC